MNPYWEGFWQVVYDDPEEEIIRYDPFFTTLSLRASGFSIYAGGFFIQIRIEKGRRPPVGWPATDHEKLAYFQKSKAFGGRCVARNGDTWDAEHEVTTAADPRLKGKRLRYTGRMEGDSASVEIECSDGVRVRECWRRLSGPGVGPLAGAWESMEASAKWMYLTTAGHYGVIREETHRPAITSHDVLPDDATLALCDGFGANAGALIATKISFDHWPMVSSNLAGFEARKHETFRWKPAGPDQLKIGFARDGSDAAEWHRLR